jgi:cytochrome b561
MAIGAGEKRAIARHVLESSEQKSQASNYSSTAIALHWLIAALILLNVVLGFGANFVQDEYVRGFVDLHKSIGITVLGLAIVRILWRLTHRPPPLPSKNSPLERLAAHSAHWMLYVLIFAIPISGWLHDSAWKEAATHPVFLYGIIPWPRISWIQNMEPAKKEHLHAFLFNIHVYLNYALYALLAVHILGALKHQYWDGEAELQRMAPAKRR